MNEIVANQAYLFLIFILNGILIGILFDIFRILRRSFKTPNFVTYIEDILFWIISTLSVIYSLFVFNNGEIRGYIFIGLIFGIAIYMLFFSKIVMKVSIKIMLLLKQVFKFLYKILSYPVKIILNPLKFLIKKLFSFKIDLQKLKIKSKSNKNLQNKEGF